MSPLRRLDRRAIVLAFATVAVAAPVASAVVLNGGGNLKPQISFVGQWRGGSGVAVGPRTILSAGHLGGHAGEEFKLGGQGYIATAIDPVPGSDLLRITVDADLPGYYELADSGVKRGASVLVAGFGASQGMRTKSGISWSGSGAEFWGSNTLEAVKGGSLTFRFDKRAGANEASLALGDSGGGVFVIGRDGSLKLAGINLAVQGRFGETRNGDVSIAINLAGKEGFVLGGKGVGKVPAPGAGALVGVAGLVALRRRR